MIWIVIPVYNEKGDIMKFINEISKLKVCEKFVIVDDGSSQLSFHGLTGESRTDTIILSHIINRGVGAATFTGIQYALNNGAEYVITMDGDGQHAPSDLPKMIEAVQSSADIVLGSRYLNRENMPLYKKLYNLIANVLTYFMYGLYISDTQSGYKAFTRKALEKIRIKADGYEFCSEMIREIKRKKLRYKEVPIKTIYDRHTLKKGLKLDKGIEMILKLFIKH